jgi:hypothetical protein
MIQKGNTPYKIRIFLLFDLKFRDLVTKFKENNNKIEVDNAELIFVAKNSIYPPSFLLEVFSKIKNRSQI